MQTPQVDFQKDDQYGAHYNQVYSNCHRLSELRYDSEIQVISNLCIKLHAIKS